jgi:hypothetical protein
MVMDVNRPWTITTARELATFFLWSVERRTEMPRDYEDDPRVEPIVAALARLDIHQIDRTLGAGSFGVASRTLRGQVLKLTADPAEVKVAAMLIGKNLPHVVAMYGAWFIRHVELKMATSLDKNGSPIFKNYQAGIIIEQEVSEIPRGLRKELSHYVMVWKDDTENHPKFYEHLPEHEKRRRLNVASIDLEENLKEEANMLDNRGIEDSARLFRGVASALHELRDVGVFAIDVHGGNVGLDAEAMRYRIFDVGVGSPPPEAPQPEVLDVPPPGRPTRPEGFRPPVLPPAGGLKPFVDPAQLRRGGPPAPSGPQPKQESFPGFREGLHVADAVLGRDVVVEEL